MNKIKMCSKCKRKLPMSTYYYHRNKSRKDGLNSFCKECKGGSFGETRISGVRESKSCLNCHKIFQVPPHLIDRKFCSHECFIEYSKANKLKEVCEQCGDEYLKEKRNERFCSHECHSENKFKMTRERIKKNNNIDDLGSWLYHEYWIEQRGFRTIMKLLNTNNNRMIKKLLVHYGIPIRYGSEAIKTQWVDNEDRKKKQIEVMRATTKGNTWRRLSFKEIKERYIKKDMKVLEREIINSSTRIHYQCLKCGGVSYQTLGSDRGCSHCFPVSYGEETIKDYFDRTNTQYISQYTIPNCRHINPLPFDFGVFSNDKLIALIEYQGKQHYEVVDHWGGREGLKERQRNDLIKKNYCKANNIPLIEVHYTVEDIEGYIEEQLRDIKNPLQLSIL